VILGAQITQFVGIRKVWAVSSEQWAVSSEQWAVSRSRSGR